MPLVLYTTLWKWLLASLQVGTSCHVSTCTYGIACWLCGCCSSHTHMPVWPLFLTTSVNTHPSPNAAQCVYICVVTVHSTPPNMAAGILVSTPACIPVHLISVMCTCSALSMYVGLCTCTAVCLHSMIWGAWRVSKVHHMCSAMRTYMYIQCMRECAGPLQKRCGSGEAGRVGTDRGCVSTVSSFWGSWDGQSHLSGKYCMYIYIVLVFVFSLYNVHMYICRCRYVERCDMLFSLLMIQPLLCVL